MPPKRHFDFESSSDAPEPYSSEPGAYPTPAKRRHLTSTPVRSPPRSSDCSLYSEYSTPYTPYAKSVPSDSPTNPFGFVRRHVRLGLPKETSYSRHLALRFQLVSAPDLPPVRPRPRKANRVDHRGDSAFWECEGTYRIVQVPLNYSLAHIHALVLFLFNGDPSRAHNPPPPGEQGYLFEAKRDISYYHESWRPATLSGGTTWAKASRVQDPYYSAKSFAELVEASNSNADELPFFEEDEDWSWENEDEFGLANVWPPGGDLSKAIVYVRVFITAFCVHCLLTVDCSVTTRNVSCTSPCLRRASQHGKASVTSPTSFAPTKTSRLTHRPSSQPPSFHLRLRRKLSLRLVQPHGRAHPTRLIRLRPTSLAPRQRKAHARQSLSQRETLPRTRLNHRHPNPPPRSSLNPKPSRD